MKKQRRGRSAAAAAPAPARRERPDQKTYQDLPIRALTEWTVDTVRQALREFVNGQFTRAAMLADAMMGDDRVGGVIDTRVLGVTGLPFSIEDHDGDGRRKSSAVRALGEDWWEMVPEPVQQELLRCGILMGWCLAEIVWDTSGPRWVPSLKPWHPQFVEYRWFERRWYVYTTEGAVPVVLGPEGGNKWVLLTPGGGDRPWMGGLLRRLAIPWLIRQFAFRDWARYSEVHGLPIRKARVPSNAAETDRARFLGQLTDLGSESVILTPTGKTKDDVGFDLVLEEAKGDSWEAFDRLMAKSEAAIAIAVLGQNLTTEVDGGSFAAANVHDRVRMDYIQADTETLTTGLRAQLVEPWAEFNLGNRDLAPWPCWDVEPPTDQQALATKVAAVGTAASAFATAQAPVDQAALLELFGIPVLEADPAKQALGRRLYLASGDRPRGARGFMRGQLYADALADGLRPTVAKALAPDLLALVAAVEGASDYDGLRAALTATYSTMDPAALAGVIEQALVLADLGGRLAVKEDG